MNAKRRRRAVIYIRISRTTEESVSLERQEATLRAMCKLEGWEVVEVTRDDGMSGTKERPEANRALAMLTSGAADTLVVWKFDRWSRQGLPAVARLIEVLDSRKGLLFYAKEDGLRSDSSLWRMLATLLAEMARMEAENTKDRVNAMRAHVLSQSRPEAQRFLGGVAPFGYMAAPNPNGPGKVLRIDEYEAAVVRDIAARLVAGDKLSDVTVALDRDGVPTPQSNARRERQKGNPSEGLDRGAWRVTTVRNLWRSETLIGRTTKREPLLDEHGEPLLDEHGKPRLERRVVTDQLGLPITRWEPILDADTFEALRRRLPSVGRVQPRRMASWLTNVARCEACSGKLYVQKRRKGDRVTGAFRCANGGNVLDKCTAPTTVDVAKLEAYIEDAFLGFGGHLPELIREERITAPEVERELRDVALAIDDATKAMTRDGADYVALLGRLDELKTQRRELQARPSAVEVILTPTGRTLADVWHELGDDLDGRREYLGEVIERVFVGQPPRRFASVPLDDERVVIKWNRDRVPEVPGHELPFN